MMPPKDKKPAEGLLIGLLSEKPSKASKEESGPMESEDLESTEEGPDLELMGQEVLDAIESKDAKGLAESLKALFEACEE